MRTFFVKEKIAPKTKQQQEILRQLYKLQKIPPKNRTSAMANYIKSLRQKLSLTYGKTNYFYIHKGVKIFVGDTYTPKKVFLTKKNHLVLQELVKKHRQENKKLNKLKNYHLDDGLVYSADRSGNVFNEKNVILEMQKAVRKHQIKKLKKPTTNDDYVGIELEYASVYSHDELAQLFVNAGLHKNIRVMSDSSIRIDDEHTFQVEICVLSKYSELSSIIEKLKKIITPVDFLANETCGLHVHLDARKESAKVLQMYKNLTSMQHVLFGLSAANRHSNQYCVPVQTTDFTKASTSHYAAISRYSFDKHRTIEVRIHESTTDLDVVEKWVRLLKTIADYNGEQLRGLDSFDTEYNDLVNKIKPSDDILKFVDSNAKSVVLWKKQQDALASSPALNVFDPLYRTAYSMPGFTINNRG